MDKLIVESAFKMLGYNGKDKVTKFEGVIDSVCFDLYGCIQISLNPGIDKDGKKKDGYWFDVKRVTLSDTRVMEPPIYLHIKTGSEIGAAEKPTQRG